MDLCLEFCGDVGWNWCFWTVELEKTLESPLDCKDIKQVNPKGHQSWIFIVRSNAEAKSPILWPPDVKNWLIGKDLNDWKQEEKGKTEDKMVGWHLWLNGHEFKRTLWVGDEQGSLTCCSPWGSRVGHNVATEQQQYLICDLDARYMKNFYNSKKISN